MQFTGSRYIVAGVCCLIAFIALTSQIFVFVPWLMLSSFNTTIAVLLPFNLGVFFICWNYYLACTTDPGSPPKGWGEPETADNQTSAVTTALADKKASLKDRSTTITNEDQSETAIQAQHDQGERTVPASGDTTNINTTVTSHRNVPRPRYCKPCKGFKPPRSHHCRVCKRCVLKMDHHCPWINNCVGHFNYGHFLRFVTWVAITTGACMVLLLLRVWDAMRHDQFYLYHPELAPTNTQIVFLILNIFVDGGVLLAVGSLCVYHLWSLINNTSTIEVWEIEKVEKMIKAGKMRKTKFPYDLGCKRNYRQVLGPRLWMCLWPQKMHGTGLEYEVMDDKLAATLWPPREYQTSKRHDHEHVSEYSTTYQRHLRRRARVRTHSGGRNGGAAGSTSHISSTPIPAIHPPPEPLSNYRPHVRRGSEGWIVQDLTIQERAALYDMQYAYQLQEQQDQQLDHAYPSPHEDEDDEDVHEGFSDHENEDAFGQPTYYDDEGEEEDEEEFTDDEEDEGEDYGEEDDDISEYDDDYFDERNPYLEYDEEFDEDEEDEDEDEEEEKTPSPRGSPARQRRRRQTTAEAAAAARAGRSGHSGQPSDSAHDPFAEDMDEVSLMGRDRHMIGKFFGSGMATIRPEDLTTTDDGEDYQGEIDEWDEGEGLATGCVPAQPVLAPSAVIEEGEKARRLLQRPLPQKTLFEQIAERQEAAKKANKSKNKSKK
ncbi:Palmitoyltransferase [Actinomortierella ambigua]|nr:Palmitoyltransferase [Actinomortierella ambigua]